MLTCAQLVHKQPCDVNTRLAFAGGDNMKQALLRKHSFYFYQRAQFRAANICSSERFCTTFGEMFRDTFNIKG